MAPPAALHGGGMERGVGRGSAGSILPGRCGGQWWLALGCCYGCVFLYWAGGYASKLFGLRSIHNEICAECSGCPERLHMLENAQVSDSD